MISAVNQERHEMDEKLFKELGKTAAKAFAESNMPLNTSIAKLATQHNLNANQISRVCEAANLDTYLNKMASASDRRFEFELADAGKIISESNLKSEPKPVKEASEKDINYFVKSASLNNSSVFAPEYDADPDFLNLLSTPDEDFKIKVAGAKSSMFDTHKNTLANREKISNKLKLQDRIEDLKAEYIMTNIKIASELKAAVNLIKTAAMHSNPFKLWATFDNTDKSDIANAVFTKAAEDLLSRDSKIAAELLLEAKKPAMPEHDAYISERNVKIVTKDPIIKIIDNISNHKKIIDQIEEFHSCNGLAEKSSTTQPSVAYTIDDGQSALEFYKKLIEG